MNKCRILSFLSLTVALALTGCENAPELSELSGTVTFMNKPVPAGYIMFTPPAGSGSVAVVQIKDGNYSTKEMTGTKGLSPGPNEIRIAGFDGKVVQFWGQGKQIFNPITDKFDVPRGVSTKDFVVPESAGKNVKIEPTADI